MQRIGITLLIAALALGSYLLAGARADDGESGDAPKAGETRDPPGEAPRRPPVEDANDERFHPRLRAAARIYLGYGRVDDEARWAPFLCRMPRPARVRMSASADPRTHGRKLYYLFAKHRDDYMGHDARTPQPVGQVIVKEAWAPERVEPEPPPSDPGTGEAPPVPRNPLGHPDAEPVEDEFVSDGEQPAGPAAKPAPKGTKVRTTTAVVPVVEMDGARYRAKRRSGLFVMLKLEPGTEGTDQGWVYGTLSPDGKMVTSAGRVASCMACHTKDTHDRVFGLPQPVPPKPKAPMPEAPKADDE